jgi:hypothetical protein
MAPTKRSFRLGECAGWNTLSELRDYAIEHGWSLAEFDEAMIAVGPNPMRIAAELQLREFRGFIDQPSPP